VTLKEAKILVVCPWAMVWKKPAMHRKKGANYQEGIGLYHNAAGHRFT